jgi:hypothetical protein
MEGAGEQLLVDSWVVLLDRSDQLVDEVLVMPIDVNDSHTFSVLARSADESPPQEWPLQRRTMPPMSLSERRRERKARKLARLLVSLDEAARDARPVPTPRAVARARLRPATP